jgi:hypothetical protein
MTDYEWGQMPTFESKQPVSNDVQFQKGEVVLIENFQYNTPVTDKSIGDNEAIDMALNVFRNKGGIIVYYKASVEPHETQEFLWLPKNCWSTVTFHQLVVYSDPLPAIAIIILALVALGIVIVVAPVVWKLAGVSPLEVVGYLGGFSIVPFAIVAAVLIVLYAVSRLK